MWMHDPDDNALLREFAEGGSELAFAELVARHINKVYSVALRHTRNPHSAEEITQAVFVILAQKAIKLHSHAVLSGWLYQTARLTAVTVVRSDIRRARREQEALMQTAVNESEPVVWPHIAPLLDDAMARLSETDRHAVVLRYFDGRSLKEVGAALGGSEEAAKMRVNRAVEKLRKFFSKRGVTLTAAAITGAVAANSVQAAPAGLAVTVANNAAAGTALTASLTTMVKEVMNKLTWMKIRLASGMLGGTILAIVATSAIFAQGNNHEAAAAKIGVSDDAILITPGVSVGKVKAGMSEDEVAAVLGQPEKMQGNVMIYDAHFGFSVVCNRKKIVGDVFCGDAALANPGVKKFKGRTKEGIGMESSRADLIKALGEPTSAKPWDAARQQEQLEFKPLGLSFVLEQGKVIHIIVNLRKPQ